MERVMKSLNDADVPQNVTERAEKGWEAARNQDWLTAHGHWLLAAREGGAERGIYYKEIVFHGDLSGLLSGKYDNWNLRFQAMTEAFGVAKDNTLWLAMLYMAIVEDAEGLRLIPKKLDQQLWDDAHKHTDTSYGIVWIANKGMQVAMSGKRQQFQTLGQKVFSQLLQNLQLLESGPRTGEELPAALELVQELADALAEQPSTQANAAMLYRALMKIPEGSWQLHEGSQARTYAEHIEHAEVHLELTRHARPAAVAGSGCCLGALVMLPLAILSLTARHE